MNSARVNQNILVALLWKEWREIAAVVPVGVMWLIAAFLAVRALEVSEKPLPSETVSRVEHTLHPQPLPTEEESRQAGFRRNAIRWLIGLGAAMLLGVTAMVAAGAFAQEREGMTEHYLDSLAASRSQVWAAKLLARGLTGVFVYGCAAAPIFAYDLEKIVNWQLFGTPALFVLLASLFALVWLASTLLSNSLEALAAGFVLWLIPFFLLAQILGGPNQSWDGLFQWKSTLATYGLLAALSLVISFWLYAYRPSSMIGTRQASKFMLGLLWKEWRATRRILLMPMAGVVLAVGVGVVATFPQPGDPVRIARDIVEVCARVFPFLAAALLGANAFAGERAQRTETFLDSLPIGRFSGPLSKVAFNLILLAMLNGLSWLCLGLPGVGLRFGNFSPVSLLMLSTQLLLFGLCHLASALSDRPIRALLRAFVLLFIVLFFLAVACLSLIVLMAAHTSEARPDSVLSFESVFDGAVMAAGLLMIGIPFLTERWQPHFGRGVVLSVLLALPFFVMLVPAFQFYRLWGSSGFHQLFGAYDCEEQFWVWVTAGSGVCATVAGLVLEGRNWLGRGISVLWAEVASIGWVSGGCLLAGWVAVILGCSGRFDVLAPTSGGYLITLPHREHFVAVGMKFRTYGTHESSSPVLHGKSSAVFLKDDSMEAISLPGKVSGLATESPDGRYLALALAWPNLLRRQTNSLILFDTRRSTVRFCDLSDGGFVYFLEWRRNSKSLFCLTTNHWGFPQEEEARTFTLQLFEVFVTDVVLKAIRITRWDITLSEGDIWRPWPRGMAIDRKDVLVFFQAMTTVRWKALSPTPSDAPPADSAAYGLFRIDTESGSVRPDPAFERLKQSVKERAGKGNVYYEWRWPYYSWNHTTDRRLVYARCYDFASKTGWSQVWRLGEGDEPNRLLLDDERGTTSATVFLDEETCVFARNKGGDPKTGCQWDIVRRNTSSEQEIVVLAIPVASTVDIVPSPSHQRLVIGAWRESQSKADESSGTSWFATREGTVSEPLNGRSASNLVSDMWTPDEAMYLYREQDGYYVAEFQLSQERPIYTVRQLLDFKQHPELKTFIYTYTMVDKTSLYLLPSVPSDPRGENLSLYRVDIKTGTPKVLLRFDGKRWLGGEGITVKEAKVE